MSERHAVVRVTRGKPRLSTEHSEDDKHLVREAMGKVLDAFKLQFINKEPVEWERKMVTMYVAELKKRKFSVELHDPRGEGVVFATMPINRASVEEG